MESQQVESSPVSGPPPTHPPVPAPPLPSESHSKPQANTANSSGSRQPLPTLNPVPDPSHTSSSDPSIIAVKSAIQRLQEKTQHQQGRKRKGKRGVNRDVVSIGRAYDSDTDSDSDESKNVDSAWRRIIRDAVRKQVKGRALFGGEAAKRPGEAIVPTGVPPPLHWWRPLPAGTGTAVDRRRWSFAAAGTAIDQQPVRGTEPMPWDSRYASHPAARGTMSQAEHRVDKNVLHTASPSYSTRRESPPTLDLPRVATPSSTGSSPSKKEPESNQHRPARFHAHQREKMAPQRRSWTESTVRAMATRPPPPQFRRRSGPIRAFSLPQPSSVAPYHPAPSSATVVGRDTFPGMPAPQILPAHLSPLDMDWLWGNTASEEQGQDFGYAHASKRRRKSGHVQVFHNPQNRRPSLPSPWGTLPMPVITPAWTYSPS